MRTSNYTGVADTKMCHISKMCHILIAKMWHISKMCKDVVISFRLATPDACAKCAPVPHLALRHTGLPRARRPAEAQGTALMQHALQSAAARAHHQE